MLKRLLDLSSLVVVLLEWTVLALPGVPTVAAGGYVFCVALLALAGLSLTRRWATKTFAVLQGFLGLGALVAAIGPTGNAELGLLAALAIAGAVLAVMQLQRQRRLTRVA